MATVSMARTMWSALQLFAVACLASTPAAAIGGGKPTSGKVDKIEVRRHSKQPHTFTALNLPPERLKKAIVGGSRLPVKLVERHTEKGEPSGATMMIVVKTDKHGVPVETAREREAYPHVPRLELKPGSIPNAELFFRGDKEVKGIEVTMAAQPGVRIDVTHKLNDYSRTIVCVLSQDTQRPELQFYSASVIFPPNSIDGTAQLLRGLGHQLLTQRGLPKVPRGLLPESSGLDITYGFQEYQPPSDYALQSYFAVSNSEGWGVTFAVEPWRDHHSLMTLVQEPTRQQPAPASPRRTDR